MFYLVVPYQVALYLKPFEIVCKEEAPKINTLHCLLY